MQLTANALPRLAVGGYVTKTLVRAMKLTAILLLTCCLHVTAKVSSQTITYSAKNASLSQIFEEVEKQTGLLVIYNYKFLKDAKSVNVDVKEVELDQFLQQVLAQQGLDFVIKKGNIFITKSKMNIDGILDAPPITVRGRIVNEEGEPVVASILIKGSTIGTTSDIDGNFTLTSIDEHAILIVSGVSIEQQEIPVSSRTSIIIKSITKVNSENEVVIRTDYFGSTKRKSTMNISKVDGKEIENQPVTSLMNSLIGRVPGLDITPANGAAGSAPKIEIRGVNSLRQGGTYPLFVVDGIQMEAQPLASTGSLYFLSGFDPLSSINPADIHSIEILKDAAATAIYGTRGANGVIRITTKRAKNSGKDEFNLNISRGLGQIPKKLRLQNRVEYLEMRREAFANSIYTPGTQDPDLTGVWDTTRSTDWQDLLVGGTASILDLNSSFYTGNEKNSFRLGAGYHKEGTIYPGDNFGYHRATADLNFRHKSNNGKLEFTSGFSFGWTKNQTYNSSNFLNYALTLPPVAPKLHGDDGSLNWQVDPSTNLESWDNPLAAVLNTHKIIGGSIYSNSNLSYEILQGLKLQTSISLSNIYNNETLKSPFAALKPSERQFNTASAGFNTNSRKSILIEPKLNYLKRFGYHKLDILLGGAWQQNNNVLQQIAGTGYISDALIGSLLGAKFVTPIEDQNNEYKYTSAYARIGYEFNDRYLADVTVRRDGSSRFGPANKFATFGAASFGWIFSEESFLKNSKLISFGKLRWSFGSTGSDQIGDYQYISTYNISTLGYQNGTSLVSTRLFNPDYKWELTKKLEAAIELGFLNDRLMIDVSWYRNRTSSQLINIPLGATAGFVSFFGNFDAIVENTGLEMMLSSKNITSKRFSWSTSLNFSVPKNKLVKFDGIESSPYANTYKVGEPLSIRRTYVYTGIDTETGLYTVADINEDGIINSRDRRFSNAQARKLYLGLVNAFSYKRFNLSFLIQLSDNPIGDYLFFNPPGSLSNQPVSVIDRWKKPGDNYRFQKYVPYDDTNNYGNALESDLRFTDAAFVRLKTLSASYDFRSPLLERNYISQVKIFLQGQNLVTLTKFKGLDPETGNNLPQLRMITLGLQLNFK